MTDDKIQMYIHEIDPVEDDHLESWTQNNDTPYALETIVSHGDVPTGRGGCSLSMISENLLLLIGGANRSAQHFNDVFEYNIENKQWKKVGIENADMFEARSGHTTSVISSQMYVFGGINIEKKKVFDDLLVYDSTQRRWKMPKCSGVGPAARNSHSATVSDNKVIIFGGSSPENGPMNDTFVLHTTDPNNLRWEKLHCHGNLPDPRDLHVTFMHSKVSRQQMVVFGGRGNSSVLSTVHALDLDSLAWNRLKNADFAVCAHTACKISPDQNQFLTFGGWDGKSGILNHGATFDADSNSWSDLNIVGKSIPPRFGHASCADGNRMYTFGGMNEHQDLNILQTFQYAC